MKMKEYERLDFYGHCENEHEIMRDYPLEIGTFRREKYADRMITYDIHTAYNLRLRNVPVLVWGKKVERENRRAFVFDKKRQMLF